MQNNKKSEICNVDDIMIETMVNDKVVIEVMTLLQFVPKVLGVSQKMA